MISPTLFHFLYMYKLLVKKNCFARQNWYLDESIYSSTQWGLQSMKTLLIVKKINSKFFLLKLLISMFVSTNLLAMCKNPLGVIIIQWISLKKIMLSFSNYFIYCFLCILVFKKLSFRVIIGIILILMQWPSNLSPPMKIRH